jgi:Xaa-Pro aminopeptidase
MKVFSFPYILFGLLFLMIDSTIYAQPVALNKEFHQKRREQLRAKMPDNSVAIFVSNPKQTRSADTEHRYKQNTDLYYFSGIQDANAILLVFKNEVNIEGQKTNDLIFISPKNADEELWHGIMLGEQGAKEKSGVNLVIPIENYKKTNPILAKMGRIYASLPQYEQNESNEVIIQFLTELFENYKIENDNIEDWLHELREIKTPEEIAILKHAVIISGQGHIEAMKSIQPGISERQIPGVHEFVHRAMGAEDAGYLPIIGAGNNGCILHYSTNDKEQIKDRLVLMDVGAEYMSYTGDITRTVPVKGFFNQEEKLVYDLVLNALEEGIQAAKKGSTFRDIDQACRKTINDGLVQLGIIKAGENHNYFPHGVSHHMGLDVHDRGNYKTLKPGMVITVEPGIYIPENSNTDKKWWNIAVRIEDNFLITEDRTENLSAFVPKTTKDIESIMKEKGILQKYQE